MYTKFTHTFVSHDQMIDEIKIKLIKNESKKKEKRK